MHQYILNGTSTSPQSSSKNVLVTNPPVLFGIFFVLVSPPVHQSKTYVDKHVAKGGGTISLRGFSKIFWGWKIFPTPFLVNFDVFLVDFDAKIHMRGENLPKIPNGGWKITTRTTPQTGGEKILGIF